MELDEIAWGDVLVDTGDVIVCQGEFDQDAVLVKRWSAGALDAELAARRRLQAAGVATASLLGSGPGWMVLEDLGETIWRPASHAEMDDPNTLTALGAWFASAHRLPGDDLPRSDAEQVLTPAVVEAAASLLGASSGATLAEHVSGWLDLSHGAQQRLQVGGLDQNGVAVVGAGMDAMVTDLSAAHGGPVADDLWAVRAVLDDAAWERFRSGYRAHGSWPDEEQLQAQEGLALTLRLVVQALTGQDISDDAQTALHGLWS